MNNRILVKDIAVGTELVVVDTGNGWGIPSTRTATVAKILKQYIELDNGRRYRIVPGGKKDDTGNYLGHERKSPGHYVSDRSYTTLLRPDAPVLETWRISRRVQDAALHARSTAEIAVVFNSGSRASMDEITAARDAMQALLDARNALFEHHLQQEEDER